MFAVEWKCCGALSYSANAPQDFHWGDVHRAVGMNSLSRCSEFPPDSHRPAGGIQYLDDRNWAGTVCIPLVLVQTAAGSGHLGPCVTERFGTVDSLAIFHTKTTIPPSSKGKKRKKKNQRNKETKPLKPYCTWIIVGH